MTELEELKILYPNAEERPEGGVGYIYIPDLPLPEGCLPSEEEALLCPAPRDGYPHRLFLASKIQSRVGRNWNGAWPVGGRTWYAISWTTDSALQMTLVQKLAFHVNAFR